jgi:hypothetical protein
VALNRACIILSQLSISSDGIFDVCLRKKNQNREFSSLVMHAGALLCRREKSRCCMS